MARIGIFQLYDKHGIVEDYVTYLLDHIVSIFDKLVIVVCGELQSEGKNKLKEYTDAIFYRNNYGFDAYAFKDAIIEFVGFEALMQYDELVLFNDTFYGPVYPFEDVFSKMEPEQVDFWGLTKHGQAIEFREHVQSYFIVIRKNMLHSKEFRCFWETLDIGDIVFDNLVHNYEVHFTDYFDNHGFCYSVYVKDDEINGNKKQNYNHYSVSPFTLVKEYGMPVIKRKVFTESRNQIASNCEEIGNLIKYVEELGYDMDMVWRDLIRKSNIYDLMNHLPLNFIIQKETSIAFSGKRPAVIACINEERTVKNMVSLLSGVIEFVDLCIVSDKPSIPERLHEVFSGHIYEEVSIRDRLVDAFFVDCREFAERHDYICIICDSVFNEKKDYFSSVISYDYAIWHNLMGSLELVNSILSIFEKDKRIGILYPPKLLFGKYFKNAMNGWGGYLKKCKLFSADNSLDEYISPSKPPFSNGFNFWCTREVYSSIADSNYDRAGKDADPIVARMVSYLAQSKGFYSGTVQTIDYASLELQNRECQIQNSRYGWQMRDAELAYYLGSKEKVYIYGAGKVAKRISTKLSEMGIVIDGYIISDDKIDSCNTKLEPVIKLSDLEKTKEIGIVLGLNMRNTKEVLGELSKRGFNDWFCYTQLKTDEMLV